MSQFMEFKITNTKFMKMGGGDPIKATEERSKALDEIRKKAESAVYEYKPSWNPFPEWLRTLIQEMAADAKSRARFDDENSVYKIKIGGERSDYDDFYDAFSKRFMKVLNDDPAAQTWSADNIVHLTSTPDDELTAMNDLELYQRNAAAVPPGRTTSEGKQ